jgi:hypothetical protein
MDIKSVGVVTVATNKYIYYWRDMAISLNQAVSQTDVDYTLHVFTDKPDQIRQMAEAFPKITVKTYKIPAYGWPEATLFRYRLINENRNSIDQELIVHLDADMKVFTNFIEELPEHLDQGIGLVRHPGFYRPTGVGLIRYYLGNPKFFLIDLKMKWSYGGLGSWERDPKFLAFVPRNKRNHYVCGGTWLGVRDNFFGMVSILAALEIEDTERGLIPTWHDESILNKWSSENRTTLLDPSFCYEPKYRQLVELPEFIRAVDKSEI